MGQMTSALSGDVGGNQDAGLQKSDNAIQPTKRSQMNVREGPGASDPFGCNPLSVTARNENSGGNPDGANGGYGSDCCCDIFSCDDCDCG